MLRCTPCSHKFLLHEFHVFHAWTVYKGFFKTVAVNTCAETIKCSLKLQYKPIGDRKPAHETMNMLFHRATSTEKTHGRAIKAFCACS